MSEAYLKAETKAQLEQVRAGRSIIGLYPATHPENLDAFQEWRKKNNR